MSDNIFLWDDTVPEEPVTDLTGVISDDVWRVQQPARLTNPLRDNLEVSLINSQETFITDNGQFGMNAVQMPNDEVNELLDLNAVYNGVWVNNAGGSIVTVPNSSINGQQIFICYDREGLFPLESVNIHAVNPQGWSNIELHPAGFIALYWQSSGPTGSGWYVFSFQGAVIT